MCRIAGLISKDSSVSELSAKVHLMCNALAHGGPDDEGVFLNQEKGFAFGHRRLSLIDLSKNGHQPMADIRQKAWITFNGEIYNYLELKSQLLKIGAQFKSGTDTEVILNAYLYWGTAAFSKLRGMFAFALYDVEKSVTLLVRDTAGIKPLYYHAGNGRLSFASEIKAFKKAGIVTVANSASPVMFLALGHIPEPFTTLKDVKCLEKGHYLSWSHQNNDYKVAAYTDGLHNDVFLTNVSDAEHQINEALKKAVKRQLIADAPIGVFLSGGIDSSLLTLLANEQSDQLKTISIYFNEKAYDEQAYQNAVLQKLKGEKFTHLVQQQDFESFFPQIIDSMDMPTTDGINTWFISKYAHEAGLKAVLSGIGADELFGGYPSFKRIKYLRYLRKAPALILGLTNYFNADKYRKISFLEHRQPLADYLLLRGLYVPVDIAKILDTTVGEVNEVLFGQNNIPPLGAYDEVQAAWFETNLYMQNQLLKDTDVLSMSHGLEVRVPFLDEDFSRLVNSIAPEIRFSKTQPKKLLINSFKNILPDAVWNRPKMGFTFPLQEWMRNNAEISNANLYHGSFAKAAVKKFNEGHLHWSKIFALYQIQLND